MNFEQAHDQLKQGKLVRRANWPAMRCIDHLVYVDNARLLLGIRAVPPAYHGREVLIEASTFVSFTDPNGDGIERLRPYTMPDGDLRSDDWEIVG